jgi:hypothetical protein
MSLARIHTSNLEVSENKWLRNRFAWQRMFLHDGNTSATILYLILTSKQLVSLKKQNMKVVELFLRVQ